MCDVGRIPVVLAQEQEIRHEFCGRRVADGSLWSFCKGGMVAHAIVLCVARRHGILST